MEHREEGAATGRLAGAAAGWPRAGPALRPKPRSAASHAVALPGPTPHPGAHGALLREPRRGGFGGRGGSVARGAAASWHRPLSAGRTWRRAAQPGRAPRPHAGSATDP